MKSWVTQNMLAILGIMLLGTLGLQAQQATFNQTSTDAVLLDNFSPTKVVAVQPIPAGRYVIDAKVNLHDDDSDAQSGSCTLVVKSLNFNLPAVVLDRTSLRNQGRGCEAFPFGCLPNITQFPQHTVVLQGTFCSNSTPGLFSIELDCASFKGKAGGPDTFLDSGTTPSVITAIQMPAINVTGGNSAPPANSGFGSCVQQSVP